MSHAHHESLPGYREGQLLVDECVECEARSTSHDHGIANLDLDRFAVAWERAARWKRHGAEVSHAEIPMLEVLWAVQVKLEARGFEIGRVPFSTSIEDVIIGG